MAIVASFVLLLLLLQSSWNARDRARRTAVVAQAREAAAVKQGAVAAAASGAALTAQTHELTVTIKAREAAHDIAEAQGGDAPVSAHVMAGWADAIDGLRNGPATGRGSDDPDG